MATVQDLFQMIAGKEVMIFDLKESLTKCQNDNKALSIDNKNIQAENEVLCAELDKLKQKTNKAKGNGKDADKSVPDESAKPARG